MVLALNNVLSNQTMGWWLLGACTLGFELCFRAFLSFVFEFFSKSAFQALWFASDGAAVGVMIKRSGQYCVLLAFLTSEFNDYF